MHHRMFKACQSFGNLEILHFPYRKTGRFGQKPGEIIEIC